MTYEEAIGYLEDASSTLDEALESFYKVVGEGHCEGRDVSHIVHLVGETLKIQSYIQAVKKQYKEWLPERKEVEI